MYKYTTDRFKLAFSDELRNVRLATYHRIKDVAINRIKIKVTDTLRKEVDKHKLSNNKPYQEVLNQLALDMEEHLEQVMKPKKPELTIVK